MVPNAPKHYEMQQNLSFVYRIGSVCCEKIWREFAARSFALIAPDGPICIEFSAQTKWSQMHQNMKFCINCTSSAHFAPSLVQEQNIPIAPKHYEMQQNMSLGSHGVFLVRL